MLSTHDYLALVRSRSTRNLPLNRVYRNIRNPELFLTAYGNLYANDGATTPGLDPTDTVQGMGKQRIRAILQELEAGTYRWQPARSVNIPKANGERRLSVPGWKDKLLQEVIRLVLDAYYEPRFRDSSHGFRPQRGCHTALKTIQGQWTGTKWFIEGDIKGCFDTIDHNILLALIAQDVQDERFIKLLREMLEAGYMEQWTYHRTYSGTPQGGVLSPLLSNILLHKLDEWVEDVLIPKHTRGKLRGINPVYRREVKVRTRAKAKGDREAYRHAGHRMRQVPSKLTHDDQYARLRYVRYADDFILGFTGGKQEAMAIKEEITAFLRELKLELADEKTLITHARTERARFLGYEIDTRWDDSKHIPNHNGDQRIKWRRINGNIGLYVPASVSQTWCKAYSKAGKPCRIGRLAQASDFEIVQEFGVKLRGLVNYYRMAHNLSYAIERVRWEMLQSLVKTLKRSRRTSVTSIYAKYYRRSRKTGRKHIRIEVQREGKPPLVATFGEERLETRSNAYLNDVQPALTLVSRKTELVARLLADQCELCGSPGETEGHHVRRLSEMRKRYRGRQEPPTWVTWMMARNRKVIFVCRKCHRQITHGQYDGVSLT